MATNKQCTTRLQKEYKAILKDPVPHIWAHPMPTNLLEWHFVLEGDKDTDYAGGVYHGKIVFPPQYPFKPPSLSLYTPNGRFATNTKLCLSFTDHHPESWNPMWSVSTILTGLLSFMHDSQPTTGSITSTTEQKRRLAAESLAFNVKNPMFKKLFPEWVEEHQRREAGGPPQQQGEPQPQQPQSQNQPQPGLQGQPQAAPAAAAAAAAHPPPQPQQPLDAHGTSHAGMNGGLHQGTATGGAQAASGLQPQLAGQTRSEGAPPGGHVHGPPKGGWSWGTTLCTLAAVVLVVALVAGPLMHSTTSSQVPVHP